MDFSFDDMRKHWTTEVAQPVDSIAFHDFYRVRSMFSRGRVDGAQLLANRTEFRSRQLRSMTFESAPPSPQRMDEDAPPPAKARATGRRDVSECTKLRDARFEQLIATVEHLAEEGRSVDDARVLLRIAMRNALGQVLRSGARETVDHAVALVQTHDRRELSNLTYRKCSEGAKRVCLPCGRSKHCSYTVMYLANTREGSETPPIVLCNACVPVYVLLHDLWWSKEEHDVFRNALDVVETARENGTVRDSAFRMSDMTLQKCMAVAPEYDLAAMNKKLTAMRADGLLPAIDAHVGGVEQ